MENNTRGTWGTRIGFIAAAAGSAVGLGNIWKFPLYHRNVRWCCICNRFIYFLFVLVCIPVMSSELLIGRLTSKNPVGAFKELAPKSSWWLVGAMGILAGFISFLSIQLSADGRFPISLSQVLIWHQAVKMQRMFLSALLLHLLLHSSGMVYLWPYA